MAGGRVGEPSLGVRLLTGEVEEELTPIATLLDTHNRERQAIEAMVLEQAMQKAEKQSNAGMILVAGEEWHSGVIGIVASRLKDPLPQAPPLWSPLRMGWARPVRAP